MEQGEFEALSRDELLSWITGNSKGAEKLALEKRLRDAYRRYNQLDWDSDKEFKRVMRQIKKNDRNGLL